MADVAAAPNINQVGIQQWFRPEDLRISEEFNVRPFPLPAELEEKKVQEMADSICEIGQTYDVIINKQREIIAGHRRRRAILIANERKTAAGQPLLKVRCTITDDPKTAWRKALHTNLHVETVGAVNLALIIHQMRKSNVDWDGVKGTKAIAKELCISTAQVSQHEKLVVAPKPLMDAVASGKISMASALDMIAAGAAKTAEQVERVIEKAGEIQVDEQIDKAVEAVTSGKLSNQAASKRLEQKNKVERPAVDRAIRETVAEEEKKAAKEGKVAPAEKPKLPVLTKKEIIEGLQQLDSDCYCDEVRAWVKYFVDKYATGMGSGRTMVGKFDAIPGALKKEEKAGKKTEKQEKKGGEKIGDKKPEKAAK